MKLSQKSIQLLLVLTLSLIWGSSFILMKRGLEAYTSYQVAAMRIFIAFIFFIPFIVKYISKISRKNIRSLLIAGFIGNGIPAFLFTIAQTHIQSNMAGILNSLTPIFALIIGIVVYKIKSNSLSIIGIIIGLIGAVNLIIDDYSNVFASINSYAILIVIATAFYGLNVNEVKENLKDLNGVAIASLAFMFIGPWAGIYLFTTTDFSAVLQTPNGLSSLGYISILAFFGSFIGLILMNILLKNTSALLVASITYIMPIFSILWGWLDGEKLRVTDFFWTMVIIAGVYLTNTNIKNHGS